MVKDTENKAGKVIKREMKKTLFILLLAGVLLICGCKKGENGDSAANSGDPGMLPELGGEIAEGADGNGELPKYTAPSDDAKKAASEHGSARLPR